MGTMAHVAWIRALLAMLGLVPGALVVLGVTAIGAATSWAGWQAGKRPVAPVVGAAAHG